VAAELLGFRETFANSLDAVSDRDFVHELLFAEAVLLNHASGLAEELILFTHPAFGFATLDDAHATGSSLMPQKKNPDVLEVARAKAATLLGALTASLATTKALPLSYNRDLQEQKRLAIETVPHGIQTLRVVADTVERLTIHEDAMAKLSGAGHPDATDLADYLVRKGVPFRDAHAQAARCVQLALARNVTLSQLPLQEFQSVNPNIGGDVLQALGPAASVAAKTSPGGTAPARAAQAVHRIETELNHHVAFFIEAAQSLERIEKRLVRSPSMVKTK
jgi:argininosuccinate lyase